MRKLIVALVLFAVTLAASAQKANVVLVPGNASDTLHQSQTLTKVADLTSNYDQNVTVQIYVDKQTGTPRFNAALYESIDGQYWVPCGVTEYYHGTADSTLFLTDTSFNGNYLKTEIITTSSTGRAKYKVNAKSVIKK